MRIATGGVSHETSTFVRTRTTIEDFKNRKGLFRGSEIVDRFRGTICTGGFIEGAEAHAFELLPLLWTFAEPSGLIVREDYDALKGEFLEMLRRAEADDGPVDGLLLDLHGAMVVEGIEDGDGDFISAVREVIGPDRPILVTDGELPAGRSPRRRTRRHSTRGCELRCCQAPGAVQDRGSTA